MAKLSTYRAKRDFDLTAEPKGRDRREGEGDGDAFVIQKHAASRLHYDLRLELDGVMKSWAVAKGPSLVPGDKRLAVHTEDHPIEYNSFEGTIPAGQYGGGTVLLWDRGRWVPQEDAHKGYAKGHLDFRLEGEKLRGAWHLVRMKKRPGERQESWLLIKQHDDGARTAEDADILEAEPRSVESGRTLEEIAADPGGRVWHSKENDPTPPATAAPAKTKPRAPRKRASPAPSEPAQPSEGPGDTSPDLAELKKSAPKGAMPKAIEPCLATLSAVVPTSDRWVHEIKWDGYRLIAFKSGAEVRLATRRGLDWTERFPGIGAAIAALPIESAILDGEAVVEDERGTASFSALQNALSDAHGKIARDAILYAFDLLYLDGHDLRGLALEDRKARLAAVIPAAADGHVRLSEHLEADGAALAKSAQELGMEGIISKRRDRPYRSGRGGDWLKIKFTDSQELVIVGYVPSTATAKAVGSLVLGYHENGGLRLAGRSGTGYTAKVARDLQARLDPLKRKIPPLAEKPIADDKRGVIWVEPELVAEIEFRGWTGEDRLRHAAFKGLREDKPAGEVVRERPKAGTAEIGTTVSVTREAKGPTRGSKATRSVVGEVAGVRLTHPDRVLWPEAGVTKQGLAEFYEDVAEWLLPHIVDRPLSLVRCPEGLAGSCFFQKHAWAGISDHIGRHVVEDEGGKEEILFVRDLAGVIALAQSSVLEIHPWGSTITDPERADRITMDLDPGDGVAWTDVIAGAREVRERLSAQGLESFLKTTGGKGLHVVVPLTGPAGWPDTKAFAKGIAEAMEADDPRRYIATASKKARRGLIYVDYLRNGRGATAIAAYSTRARAGATISVPLAWDELQASTNPDQFTVDNLSTRLRALRQDPWEDLPKIRQKLPKAKARRTARKT